MTGDAHLGARQFLVGSLFGLAPGHGAITLFSNSLWQARPAPSIGNIAIAVGVGIGLLVVASIARTMAEVQLSGYPLLSRAPLAAQALHDISFAESVEPA